jgi:hypothetical protein
MFYIIYPSVVRRRFTYDYAYAYSYESIYALSSHDCSYIMHQYATCILNHLTSREVTNLNDGKIRYPQRYDTYST